MNQNTLAQPPSHSLGRTLCRPLAIALGLMASGIAISADNFNIEVNDTDIAVQANNASLRELLKELERRTGIPVKFVSEEADERVSLNVGLTSVENAISKITPHHMIVHGKQNGQTVIKELIIIPNDSGSSSASAGSSFLPSGQPAPAIEPVQQDPAMPSPESMKSTDQAEAEAEAKAEAANTQNSEAVN